MNEEPHDNPVLLKSRVARTFIDDYGLSDVWFGSSRMHVALHAWMHDPLPNAMTEDAAAVCIRALYEEVTEVKAAFQRLVEETGNPTHTSRF